MDDSGQDVRQPIDEPKPLSRLVDCLHASFTADNHDSLGDDIIRSLLHLSREEETAFIRAKLPITRAP